MTYGFKSIKWPLDVWCGICSSGEHFCSLNQMRIRCHRRTYTHIHFVDYNGIMDVQSVLHGISKHFIIYSAFKLNQFYWCVCKIYSSYFTPTRHRRRPSTVRFGFTVRFGILSPWTLSFVSLALRTLRNAHSNYHNG